MSQTIWTNNDKEQEKFLRKKTEAYDFAKHTPAETEALVREMRATMRGANGVGLSANQVGLAFRVFVAEIPDANGKLKFYAVFNPELEPIGKSQAWFEEGCLSTPNVFGRVLRPAEVVLKGQDKKGRNLKIKAWGLLARVFEHEVDHLDGKMFIDSAEDVHHHNPHLPETHAVESEPHK